MVKFKKGSWYLAVFLVGMISLQGCFKNDADIYDANKYFYEDIQTIFTYVETNSIDAELDSMSGIFYEFHVQGDGYKTVTGAEVDVHYKASTLDGFELANNFNGNPLSIILGNASTYTATVTDALLIALLKMHEGDSITIYSPSYHGFRNNAYQNVPPNSILVYTIKFEEIKSLDDEYALIDQYILDNNMVANIEPDYGTRTVIHTSGNTVIPEVGDNVNLHYQLELLDGTVIQSSFNTGIPFNFIIGNGQTVPGFEMGIRQLHENDSATIFVPSIYGYGDQARENIPANSILVFGIKMLGISKNQ